MEAYAPPDTLYAVCESWAEEPSTEPWNAYWAAMRDWLVRAN